MAKNDLASMDWTDLIALRSQFNENPAAQKKISPYEHRAYAREAVAENPLNAIGYTFMIPGYQAAKAVGLLGARTQPSLDQLKHGYKGVGEGLLGWWNKQ